MFWYICGGLLVLSLLYLAIRRITSVKRGARTRDDRVHDMVLPIHAKLAKGEPVSKAEVAESGKKHECRCLLYRLLKHYDKTSLIPQEWLTREMEAMAQLAYWMMHPNEFKEAPAQIEVLTKHNRVVASESLDFYVLRFKMPEGHWAGTEWLLGLVGPFGDADLPYEGRAGAFSRGDDIAGKTGHDELVDWYISMCQAKGVAPSG